MREDKKRQCDYIVPDAGNLARALSIIKTDRKNIGIRYTLAEENSIKSAISFDGKTAQGILKHIKVNLKNISLEANVVLNVLNYPEGSRIKVCFLLADDFKQAVIEMGLGEQVTQRAPQITDTGLIRQPVQAVIRTKPARRMSLPAPPKLLIPPTGPYKIFKTIRIGSMHPLKKPLMNSQAGFFSSAEFTPTDIPPPPPSQLNLQEPEENFDSPCCRLS